MKKGFTEEQYTKFSLGLYGMAREISLWLSETRLHRILYTMQTPISTSSSFLTSLSHPAFVLWRGQCYCFQLSVEKEPYIRIVTTVRSYSSASCSAQAFAQLWTIDKKNSRNPSSKMHNQMPISCQNRQSQSTLVLVSVCAIWVSYVAPMTAQRCCYRLFLLHSYSYKWCALLTRVCYIISEKPVHY